MQDFDKINRQVVALNGLVSAIVGGMFGLANTIIVITLFTLVSTNYFMNFYIGGFMMILGVMLLYRVYKRRGVISNTTNTPEASAAASQLTINSLNGFEESQGLLRRTEHPAYKGGIGNDILHGPLEYKDSFVLADEWNTTLNTYIKQSEYTMSLGHILAGALCILLEKQLFKSLDDHFRVPIYMLFGSSLSFVIVYAVFDIIEIIKSMYHQVILRRSARSYTPAILTNLLYLTIISMSCIMGGGLGIVYGVADIEGLFRFSVRLVYL